MSEKAVTHTEQSRKGLKLISGRLWKGVVAGALGGLAASLVMNLFQSLWSKAEEELSPKKKEKQQSKNEGEDATVKTAEKISEQIFDHQLTKPEKKWAGRAVHYTFGLTSGAIYGVLAETVPLTRVGHGAGYGSAVWLISDEIAVPALGLSGAPSETPVSAHVKGLASHLVYGFTVELVRRAILSS